MRGVLAPIPCLVAALALAGCMGRTAPVAVGAAEQPRCHGLWRVPRGRPAAMPVAYAEPAPVRYDAAYQLDAGDRLRVVVYGQEGLTNTYAIDAGGSITMPLIGAVPARGRTPAGLAARHRRQAAQRLHPRALRGGGDRGLPAVLHPRRSGGARANIPMYPT